MEAKTKGYYTGVILQSRPNTIRNNAVTYKFLCTHDESWLQWPPVIEAKRLSSISPAPTSPNKKHPPPRSSQT